MTIDDVRATLAKIKQLAWDNEAAHAEQDELFIAVLEAIRDGAPDAPELAREALAALEIKFSRWCA